MDVSALKKPEFLAYRKRLVDDFDLYARKYLRIRNKDGDIVPLKLNAAQKILHEVVERQLRETGMVRVIILKGRQQGLSTYVSGRLMHRASQSRAKKALVLAHDTTTSKTLFEMTKTYYDELPDWLRPNKSRSNTRELVFDKLKSAYRVDTASSDGVGRGDTLQLAHASEVAFWKASVAKVNWNGLSEAIADAKGTMVFMESTANGIGNLFHSMWEGAVKGENGYEAVFIPWYLQDEYREEIKPGFARTPEEHKLAEKFGLDNYQLQWRRTKISRKGTDLFKQEYPFTAEEAFLTTGSPAFEPERVTSDLEKAPSPIRVMSLEGDEFAEYSKGELCIYREPDGKKNYVIGADVSSGVKGKRRADGSYEKDPSVAQVLDEDGKLCATWRGYKDPDEFARILNRLGEMFYMPMIAIERNYDGGGCSRTLYKVYQYHNVYRTTIVDKITEQETTRFGFDMNVKSRNMVINELRAFYRLGELEINDDMTLREMLSFVEDENGKFQGEAGTHDDTVIALAIANHINPGPQELIEPLDEYYSEAI